VYALWYSAALFEQNGWTVPKTYDEMLALGEEGQGQGQVPARLGQGGGDVLPDDGIGSAIKEGGDEVRLALENLKPDCWSLPSVQDVFNGLKKIIDAGYIKPGGRGPCSPPPRPSGATPRTSSFIRRAAGSRTR
jgi:N-acetylglucosamine transport system substrate-binding protein